MNVVDKRSVGLYDKFRIARVDGTDAPGQKHHGCRYFVLDLDHDPHALPALFAYAASCRRDYPLLSKDLDVIIEEMMKSTARSGASQSDPVPVCPHCGEPGPFSPQGMCSHGHQQQ